MTESRARKRVERAALADFVGEFIILRSGSPAPRSHWWCLKQPDSICQNREGIEAAAGVRPEVQLPYFASVKPG